MPNPNEQKTQRHFVKDGDDDYTPRRPIRRTSNALLQQHKQCECGGKLKPRGASDYTGHTSTKCNKCGRRVYVQHYKGVAGLAECY